MRDDDDDEDEGENNIKQLRKDVSMNIFFQLVVTHTYNDNIKIELEWTYI